LNIGAKVYYDKETGNVIQMIGQRSGNVIETTVEQDFQMYSSLSSRVPEMVGMIRLAYGAHEKDFEAGGVITRVDLEAMIPLLSYPDPQQPEVPTDPQKPLSEEIKEMKERQDIMQDALDALLMGGM
jgi:hypothetical protein